MAGDPDEVATDFEAWSRLSAALRDRPAADKDRILQHVGLLERWPGIAARWAEVLVDDIAQGDLERVMRYSDSCATARAERARGADPFAAALHSPPPPASTPPAAPPPGGEPRPRADFGQTVAAPRHAGPSVGAPLPFQGAPSSRPAASSGASDDFRALRSPSHAPQQAMPGQVTTAPDDFAATAQATVAAMAWTVDQYASFCAALSARAHEEEVVATQCGVTLRAIPGIHRGWRKRLAGDAAIEHQYQVALARFSRR